MLLTMSSADVRSDSDEIAFYLAAAVVWLLLTVLAFEFMGISLRDDVAARGNYAAATTICGLAVGETFCLSGANTGNGPGPEVVLFCTALSTAPIFLVWILLNAVTEIAETISVGREIGAGIRAAGFLGGVGAILGSAVAGDWISLERTICDFARFAWPVAILLVLTIAAEKSFASRFKSARSEMRFSIAYCGLSFLLCAIYAARVWNHG